MTASESVRVVLESKQQKRDREEGERFVAKEDERAIREGLKEERQQRDDNERKVKQG